ncbi:hypothetical protein [Brachybacterium massiliense]|uniref:hypothetical protein n=1 Tax=Brachybacterium massiliense TaxID=1755098 RepID=UPI000B3BB071|nr:hypothetical protein [Brachybacterium massiliense]
MVLRPTFYQAELFSGNLLDTPLPLEQVSLSSSLAPGRFSAVLDCRKLGVSVTEARKIVGFMKRSQTTLVPVIETPPDEDGLPTSTPLGEWLIEDVTDDIPTPFVRLSGIEFSGYAKRRALARDWGGPEVDPLAAAGQMWQTLATTDQVIEIVAGSWRSPARVVLDMRRHTMTYWDAMEELSATEEAPFEWCFRPRLYFDWYAPHRVGRFMDFGQPVLSIPRPDVTLEVAATGSQASLISSTRTWAESGSVSHVWGFGAGSGDEQIRANSVMWRSGLEPARDSIVTVPTALTPTQLKRYTNAAVDRLRPEKQVFQARMLSEVHTPQIGEVYEWRNDECWTRDEAEGQVRCVGWSWSSGQALDAYTLDLVEVA